MSEELPQEVKVCLWSYDTDKIDLHLPDHRFRLIQNVLDRGSAAAVAWLLDKFPGDEIARVIRESSRSQWSKKSLSLWSLVFGVSPARESRFA